MLFRSDWTYVEVDYNSGKATRTSVNLLHVARGDGYFDDVKLCELISPDDAASQNIVGNVARGDHIFHKHVAACVLCHMLKGQGSTVGPALDGIALWPARRAEENSPAIHRWVGREPQRRSPAGTTELPAKVYWLEGGFLSSLAGLCAGWPCRPQR